MRNSYDTPIIPEFDDGSIQYELDGIIAATDAVEGVGNSMTAPFGLQLMGGIATKETAVDPPLRTAESGGSTGEDPTPTFTLKGKIYVADDGGTGPGDESGSKFA